MMESESEEEGLDESDDDENDHEPEPQAEKEPVVEKPVEVLPPKEADRQLSKKELKKKELAELDAVLAELGLNDNNTQEDTRGKLVTFLPYRKSNILFGDSLFIYLNRRFWLLITN
ncbi:hypothetical protein HanHA300_Chr03g0075011 [Helianthus annuus]|nr:hypothetical protein HanHA300_Chr03g0075011 [Helianthus annuus]KAJ0772479.1 hypothetical protein HanOQP8_Chr03g0087781 [Helianthus annuus]